MLSLTTARLHLRGLTTDDEKEIFILRSDTDINRYIGRQRPDTLRDARAHIEKLNASVSNNESFFWGITLKDHPTIIGTICLWNLSANRTQADIGFDLLPGFQRMGYMQEAVLLVLTHAFETLRLKKISGWVNRQNQPSISLLTKSAFKRDKPEEDTVGTEKLDGMIIYSLTRDEFFNNQ